MNEELRSTTPIFTAKDVLIQLNDTTREMDKKLDTALTALAIIQSQNLNERVAHLESIELRSQGRDNTLRFLGGTSVVSFIAAIVSLLLALRSLGIIG